MAEYDLVILNGTVVTDQEIEEFDIAIKDGKISKVEPRGAWSGVKTKKTIDARGGMVMVCCHSRTTLMPMLIVILAWRR